MSRFVSAVAAREKRTGTADEQLTRLEWLQRHRQFFFAIGRAVLEQRAKFAARTIEHFSAWERLPELAHVDPRARFTYGVSYAAFLALNEIIPIYTADKCAGFRNWQIEKVIASAREVAEQVDVNQFWRDFLSALANGVFGDTPSERARYFKLMENKKPNPRLSEQQLKDGAEDPRRAWKSYLFYFQAGPVIDLMRKYKHSQGRKFALDQGDLLAQMKVRSYFVKGPRQGHAKKFGRGSRINLPCWCIDLDEHEQGLLQVSDEDWVSSFYHDGDQRGELLPIDDWIDPRKGDLFAILDALKERED